MDKASIATNAGKSGKIFTLPFIILFVLYLCSSSVTFMVNTIFTDYSLVILGTTISLAGTIAGMTNIGSFIILPFCGPAVNRLNKRTLLQASLILFVISAIGFTLTRNIPLIMFFRLISGFGNGIAFTSGMVMVVEALPEHRITEGVGYYGLAGIIMEAIGPFTALFLVENFSYSAAFLVAGLIPLIGFILAFKLPASTASISEKIAGTKGKTTVKDLLQEIIAKESLLPAVIGSLFALINGIQHAFLIPYAKDKGLAAGAGLYFTVNAFAMFAARLIFGRFVQKRTIAFAVVFSGAFLIMCPLLLGLGSNMVTMLLAGILFGIGYGILLPVTQSTSIKFAPPNRKGSGSSTYYIGIRLAFAIGPTLGGVVAQDYGYSLMFLILVIPSLLAIALGLLKGRILINPEHMKNTQGKSMKLQG